MAILSALYPTLLDVAQRKDPDGTFAPIAELLNQTNEIIPDIPWMEGNLETGHRSTIRVGLPTPTWRKFYGGIPPSKSTTATITDACGMMKAMAEIDADLADMSGDARMFRFTESIAHIEAMGQEFVNTLFFGDTTLAPEEFHGLKPRYNTLSGEIAKNVISGGGAGADNASIWLAGWGPHTLFGIYPKGSVAGIKNEDLGRILKQNVDGAGAAYQAYVSMFSWMCGLVVKDWRYVVRVCNIDRSALTSDASSGAHLPNLMAQALDRLPTRAGMARPVFYMDMDTMFRWRQQMAYLTQNSTLTMESLGGVKVEAFHGVPVKRVDVLYADEATVT